MQKSNKYIKTIIISIIIISAASIVFVYNIYQPEIKVFLELNKLKDDNNNKYYYEAHNNKRIEINIPNDAEIDDVIYLLKQNGELKGLTLFKYVCDLKGYTNNIVTGQIILEGEKYSLLRLVNSLKIKKRETIDLQIPENIRLIQNMIILLEDSLGYERGKLKNYLDTSNFLQTNNFTMETLPAFFIPNTYELYTNISIEEFLNKMNAEYRRFWNTERLRKLDSLNINIPDSLRVTKIGVAILASIIEEEQDKKIEERPIIAGLYLNRIQQNIKLQSDPTVIFANNDFTIKRVLKRHLRLESLYNTYIHKGLPPGPICIPSINSIDAVLNAEDNNYIFMCGKGDGSGLHNFAITLRDHNNNKKIFKRNVGFN